MTDESCRAGESKAQNPFVRRSPMNAISAEIDNPPDLGSADTKGTATRAAVPIPQPSVAAIWTGRIMNGLVILFLLFDATVKVLKLPVAVKGTTELGYPESVIVGLGIVPVICLALYIVPR